MVEIGQPSEPSDLEALGDVLLGALGITGVIVLLSVLVGVAVGGLLFWVRSRSMRE